MMNAKILRPAITGIVASLTVLSGCEQTIVQPVVVSLLRPPDGGGEPAPSGCHTVPPPECTSGACCYATETECYPFGNPSPYSGAECMAQRDNTEQPRWQLRQTLSVSTRPPGLAVPQIASVLVRRSELRSEACGTDTGTSGFMQLIDFDKTAGTSRTGFAKYAPGLVEAREAGLCFVEEVAYENPALALRSLYAPPEGWPRGLPPPMPMPWKVAPVTALRLEEDFVLPRDRVAILERFAEGGDLAGSRGGVFYLNEASGRMHGYSPVTYIVTYNSATDYFVVPIREAEITQQLNDPAHPNCSGVLFGDIEGQEGTCLGDATNRAWGCPEGNCTPDQLAPTKIEGYFLLAELEQVALTGVLTLCNLFSGGGYPEWTIPASGGCRGDPKWDPMNPVTGLPKGDWCATTNSDGDETCHDAWKSVSFATFQAFPVQDGTCGAL